MERAVPSLRRSHLSDAGAGTDTVEQNWLTVISHNGLSWVLRMLCIGLGLVALALFSAQRHHKEYLVDLPDVGPMPISW